MSLFRRREQGLRRVQDTVRAPGINLKSIMRIYGGLDGILESDLALLRLQAGELGIHFDAHLDDNHLWDQIEGIHRKVSPGAPYDVVEATLSNRRDATLTAMAIARAAEPVIRQFLHRPGGVMGDFRAVLFTYLDASRLAEEKDLLLSADMEELLRTLFGLAGATSDEVRVIRGKGAWMLIRAIPLVTRYGAAVQNVIFTDLQAQLGPSFPRSPDLWLELAEKLARAYPGIFT